MRRAARDDGRADVAERLADLGAGRQTQSRVRMAMVRDRGRHGLLRCSGGHDVAQDAGELGRVRGGGATTASGHPPAAAVAVAPMSSHGATVDALRPACASWIATFWPCVCANCTMRRTGAICSSLQRPESSGVMRPSGATAVASIIVRPGPRVKIPPTAGARG